MNFELLRELAGLPTLKEAAGFRFQPSWCLIDSHTDEVLSSSSDKQKLIAKQDGKYGQTSTEIMWGYADEDGDFRDTIESIKRISARFKTSWYNRETEEIVPYAPETIDQYYSTAHATPWVVILENTLNLHHPRIFEATRVATWYHPLLDYSGFAGPVDTE